MAVADPVLLLNMTRLGDLVQTTPLAVGLKRMRPDVPVVVAAAKEFESAARIMGGVDEVVTIDQVELLRIASLRGVSPAEMIRMAEGVLSPLLNRRFSKAINLTHSDSSGLMMNLVEADEKSGLEFLASGRKIVRHPWLMFFYNYVRNMDSSPFNLVDMYSLGGGVPQNEFKVPLSVRVPDEAVEWARNFVAAESSGDGPLIALQVGASDSHKMWLPSSFIRFGRLLKETVGARFLFIGGKADVELAERVAAVVGAPGSVMAAGRTDLHQLCALLSICDLMVTNDTGPMHLAAAVGTPVVSIALGPVYYSNTGPYGPGHVVFQPLAACAPCSFHVKCGNPECKGMVTPEAVAKVVTMRLKEGVPSPRSIPDGPDFAESEVYVSAWGSDGLIDYFPVIDRPDTFRWKLQRAYRKIWVDSLLHGDAPPGSSTLVPLGGGGVIDALRDIEGLATKGRDAAAAIKRRSAKRSSADIEAFRAAMDTIGNVSDAIRHVGFRVPETNALCQMFVYEAVGLADDLDLEGAARENVRVFGALLRRTRSLAYLLSGEHEAGLVPAGKGR